MWELKLIPYMKFSIYKTVNNLNSEIQAMYKVGFSIYSLHFKRCQKF